MRLDSSAVVARNWTVPAHGAEHDQSQPVPYAELAELERPRETPPHPARTVPPMTLGAEGDSQVDPPRLRRPGRGGGQSGSPASGRLPGRAGGLTLAEPHHTTVMV